MRKLIVIISCLILVAYAVASATVSQVRFGKGAMYYVGLSSDTKPNIEPLSYFYETDTKILYMFMPHAGGWLPVISNTTGTNSGDETEASILSKLSLTAVSGYNTGDQEADILSKLSITAISGYNTGDQLASGVSVSVTSRVSSTDVQTALDELSRLKLECSSHVSSTVTGTTAETLLATCTVPAGAMGTTGSLFVRVGVNYTTSTNAKNVGLYFGGASVGISGMSNNTKSSWGLIEVYNKTASTQVAKPGFVLSGSVNTDPTLLSINTAATTTIGVTCALGSAGEFCAVPIIEGWIQKP